MKKKAIVLISILFLSLFVSSVQAGTVELKITDAKNLGFVETGFAAGYFKIKIDWSITLDSSLIDHFEIKYKNKGGLIGGDYTKTVAKVSNTTRTYVYKCWAPAIGHTKQYLYVVAFLIDGTTVKSVNQFYLAGNALSKTITITELKTDAEEISTFIDVLIDWILKIPIIIFNFIVNTVSSVFNFLSSLIENAVSGISASFGLAQPIAATVVGASISFGVYLIIKLLFSIL